MRKFSVWQNELFAGILCVFQKKLMKSGGKIYRSDADSHLFSAYLKKKCPAGIRQDTQKHRRTAPVSYKRFCRSLCTELKNLFDGHYKGCVRKLQAYFQNLPKCRTCPKKAREFCDIRQGICLQTEEAFLIKIILIFPHAGGITEPAAARPRHISPRRQ